MEISSLGLLMGLLLLALPLYIVFAFDLRLLRRLGMSLVSMAMVVVVLGAVVGLLSRYDKLWLNIVAGVGLPLLLSGVVVAKSGLCRRRLLAPVMAASVLPQLALTFYVLLLVLSVKTPFAANLFVPMVSVLTGLSSGLVARALRAYYIGLEHHNELYCYLLGNGATHREAVRHFMRRGFQAALLTAMKRMSGLFLTGAPVLMLGLVMSGVGVWTAVFLEVVLTVAVLGCALSTFWMAVVLSRRYGFDEYERLRPMKRHESSPAPTAPPVSPESPTVQTAGQDDSDLTT
mgnify:FL=1